MLYLFAKDVCFNIDETPIHIKSYLHLAAKETCLMGIHLLLEHKMDINVVNKYDKTTALNYACTRRRISSVKCLINHKADLNIPDRKGNTPLVNAIQNHSTAIASILIQNKCNVNMASRACSCGRGVIGIARDSPLIIATKQKNFFICKKLIKAKAMINYKNYGGKSALSYAIYAGSMSYIRFLCENGANVNNEDCNKVRMLKKLVSNDFFEKQNIPYILDILLRYNTSICFRLRNGMPFRKYVEKLRWKNRVFIPVHIKIEQEYEKKRRVWTSIVQKLVGKEICPDIISNVLLDYVYS